MRSAPTPELFRNFPKLRRRVPWVPLARSTPVHRLERLESYLHKTTPIWVKRDDRTSDIYGGNKARHFEFVFGDVLRHGSRRVLTFGAVGSNHGLAVSAFAHHFKLKPILALVRQPLAHDVQRTLQIEHDLGADLHRLDGGPRALWRLLATLIAGRGDKDEPRLPYVLRHGNASLLGALGYVNAAYELKRQINCGILPKPKSIYVPVGSGATLAGLLLGCELAEIDAHLVGVVSWARPGRSPLRLARRVASYLGRRTRDFPVVHLRRERLELRRSDATVSGLAASKAQHAAGLLRDLESLDLDPVYTSHAMRTLIEDIRDGRAEGPILFWHTHAANIFAREPSSPAEALPREFREFFVAH